MRRLVDNPDRVVAKIAADQHGVITTTQLLEVGISDTGIRRRVASGHLHRVHRGVYAVGHSCLGNEGRWIAAVLAGGEGAVLSHRSAAELWTMLPTTRGIVHITVPGQGGRAQRAGLRIHRSTQPLSSTTWRRRIPVTAPARTLADLRRCVDPPTLRRATRQAAYLDLDLGAIATDRTRSELERAFLGLCRRHRLPGPEVNVSIGLYTVDFLWRGARLVVETDGYAAHRGRQAFEDDRARELWLHARGYRVLRFTDRQVKGSGPEVVAAIRALVE